MTTVGAATDLAVVARATLEDLRQRVGMDTWWLTRRRGDEQVALAAVGSGPRPPSLLVVPWEGPA